METRHLEALTTDCVDQFWAGINSCYDRFKLQKAQVDLKFKAQLAKWRRIKNISYGYTQATKDATNKDYESYNAAMGEILPGNK